jgi:transcriptional regulator with XRE-family HTH domain
MTSFEREVLPGLAGVTLRELAESTGLSRAYLRRVVRGEVVPHPMWWETLRGLAG